MVSGKPSPGMFFRMRHAACLAKPLNRIIALVFFLAGSGAAQASEEVNRDPWQPLNRTVFAFNEQFDRVLGKPLARGYQAVTPAFVDNAITAFFRNADDVTNSANFALQGEGGKAASALGRVVANTLIGFGGLIDVASSAGVPRHATGFGTTLGHWGAGSGPYLVLPFLGPSTVREAAGLPVDMTLDPLSRPLTILSEDADSWWLTTLKVVDMRADLLRYEEAVIGDRYTFLRDLYLQRIDFNVNGAPVKDAFLED